MAMTTMQYVDQHGRIISLGPKIGVGGEGAVYEIANSRDFVAKIYHRPVTGDKATKLAAMVTLASPDVSRFAAWPIGILRNGRDNHTIGIVLPRVQKSYEIHELYSPAHRKFRFPRADWRFLIRTARNCAAAFSTLHSLNVVIGDVNQGNLFVSPQATVSLIDCDSFQMQVNGHLFHCPVGVAHFVPPELQQARLSDVVRTYNHDNFGLAIVIFHLLFMGRHPFSGRFSGAGDMPIERAIQEYRFAYSRDASKYQMAPPPNSLTLAHLPQPIANFFERAFARGSELPNARPTSQMWAQSLEQLERYLCHCQSDPGHYYSKHLQRCPWCEIIGAGGPNFFISVSIESIISRSAAFDLAGIWSAIEAVAGPEQSYVPLPRHPHSRIVPHTFSPEDDDEQPIRITAGILAIISAAVLPFAYFVKEIAIFSVLTCSFFIAWWLVLKSRSPMRKLERELKLKSRDARNELQRAKSNQRDVAHRYEQQFQSKLAALGSLRNTYKQLKSQRDSEIQSLQQHVHKRQLDKHLERCFISGGRIPGIGPGRIATLESYGIETAKDVEQRAVMRVPGFGSVMTERLLVWRRQMESEFRFNPSAGIPQSDIQAIEMKYAQKRSECERQFQFGPHELRQIATASKAELERLDGVIVRLEYENDQLSADLRSFRSLSWWK